MLISFDMLEHIRYMQKAIDSSSLEGGMSIKDLSIALRLKPPHVVRLIPQFLSSYHGKKMYYYNLSDQTKKFSGWRPYPVRSWKATQNKVKFKEIVEANGFNTPKHSKSKEDLIKNVIVKKVDSCFSEGIRGPYKSNKDTKLNVGKGEYFEQFIEGNIVKIWFFESIPVAAEVADMPYVVGDGLSNIGDLLSEFENRMNVEVNVSSFEEILRYYSMDWSSVVEKDKKVIIEFKYSSSIPISKFAYDVRIGKDDFFGLEDHLKKLGSCLFSEIPEDMQDNIVYSVDGIVSENKLWLLEMNSNPFVHPYVYEPMINNIQKQLEMDVSNEKVA